MGGGDAGVNHRDADAGTVVSEITVNHRGAHGGSGPLHGTGDRTVLRDLRNERVTGQGEQRGVRQFDNSGADVPQFAARRTAGHTNQCGQGIR